MAFFDEYYTLFIKSNVFQEQISTRPFDKWILKKTYDFVEKYTNYLNNYEINPLANLVINYIDQLNNNYIRLNRDVIKGKEDNCLMALSTLKKVLNILSVYLSPILPFLCEKIYQNINKTLDSVHLQNVKSFNISNIYDEDIKMIDYMLKVVEMTRKIRNTFNLQLKMPLKKMIVYCDDSDLIKSSENYILTECNLLEMEVSKWEASSYIYKYTINLKTAGKLLREKRKDFETFMTDQSQETLSDMFNGKVINFNDISVNSDLVTIHQVIPDESEPGFKVEEDIYNKLKIKLNIDADENTNELYLPSTNLLKWRCPIKLSSNQIAAHSTRPLFIQVTARDASNNVFDNFTSLQLTLKIDDKHFIEKSSDSLSSLVVAGAVDEPGIYFFNNFNNEFRGNSQRVYYQSFNTKSKFVK
jgi:isoleucyl-tRNA synthetase